MAVQGHESYVDKRVFLITRFMKLQSRIYTKIVVLTLPLARGNMRGFIQRAI